MRKIAFTPSAFADYNKFVAEEDYDTLKKIDLIIRNIQQDFFRGLGKPEPLKGDLKGYWSRRITIEHRLVYRVTNDAIDIIQCYGHY